jgi:hypothetical protein
VDSRIRTVSDDNPDTPGKETPHSARRWSASPGLVAVAWIGAAAAAGWCGLLAGTGRDPAGLLLAAVTTAGLGVAALFGTRARPRLAVGPDGLSVGGLAGTRHHPWERVRDVRVLHLRRFGRDTALLEVDVVTAEGDEQLIVFGRLDLGDDPVDVAAAVLAARPGQDTA